MPSTLYSHQESNIQKTWLLIAVFLIIIIGLGWLLSYLLDSPIILYVAVAISLLMNMISYWHSDKIALAISHAKRVDKKRAPDLYRSVENLCITSGLSMPRLYLMDTPQINAFATGRDSKHAALAITTGALQKLSRTELEGVLAHELSHIKNRDILVASLTVVLVGIIALLSDFFLRLTFFGFGDRDRQSNTTVLALIVGLIAAILAPMVATLIRLTVSRRREFLADASGALLTRYPEGLAAALEKIARDNSHMRQASNATAHLFLANPFRGRERTSWFTKLFMTHPPLEDRIRILRELKI